MLFYSALRVFLSQMRIQTRFDQKKREISYLSFDLSHFRGIRNASTYGIFCLWQEMTWENHGQGVGNWNIDHVIPLRSNSREMVKPLPPKRVKSVYIIRRKRIYLKGPGYRIVVSERYFFFC